MTADGPNIVSLYLCHLAGEADFASCLALDLKNAGFDVVTEKLDSGDKLLESISYAVQHYAAALPILPAFTTEDDLLLRDLLDAHHRVNAHRVLPLLLYHHSAQPVIEASGTVNFGGWHDEYRYQQSLDTLRTLLDQQFPPSGDQLPSAHHRYLNGLLQRVARYKGLLATLGPQTRLDSPQRGPGLQSMWGMTATFLVQAEMQDNAPVTGYLLPQLVETYPRCLIVGDAGSGKTTALYRLLLEMTRASESRPDEFPLPLFVHLGWWTGSTTLEDFIRSGWPFASDPFPLLASGSVQLLIDGLDELPEPFDERWQALRAWLHDVQGPARVIITCDSPTSATIDAGLPVARLAQDDPVRIRQYVAACLDKDPASTLLTRLLPAADAQRTPAQRLAHNAFYLAIIVAMTQDIAQPDTPEHPGLLLNWLADHLWRVGSHSGRLIEREEVFDRLSWLAASTLDDGLTTWTTHDYALDRCGSDAALQAALSARLLFMEGERVRFGHPLLRDYFAARYLLGDGVYTRLMRASFTQSGQRIPWKWDRAILFSSALSDNPSIVVREIAEVNPYLALDCLISGAVASEHIQRDAVRRLLAFISADDRPYLPQIMQLLRQTADSHTLALLLEELHSDLNTLSPDKDSQMTTRNLRPGLIQQLIDVLRREKPKRRRGAAVVLGSLQETSAVPNLIEALRDENAEVRKGADYALTNIGHEALPHLRQFLHDPAPEMRAAIIKVLGRIAAESTVADLIACLSDDAWSDLEETRICDLAATALEHIGTEDALHAVDSWRQNPPVPISRAQATTLHTQQAHSAGDDSLGVYRAYLDDMADNEWQIRRNAVKKLAETRDDRVIPYLLTALEDEDSQVIWTAIRGLERFRGPEIIEGLLRALEHDEHLIVDAAAEALSKLGEEAIPGLIEALRHADVNVRGAAVEALGSIGSEAAIPHLVDALDDNTIPDREGSTTISDFAAQALERIGTDKALFALNQWRKQELAAPPAFDDDDPTDSMPSLLDMDAMSTTTHPAINVSAQRAAVLDFLDQLDGGSPQSQQHAVERLREHFLQLKQENDIQAIERLTSALSNQQTLVRWMAAEALAFLGDDSVTPALIQFLNDDNWQVRLAGVRSMMEINDHAAVPALLQALRDKNQLVRETAAEALGRLGDTAATPGLIAALDDSDSFVRRAAATALSRIGDTAAVPALLARLDDSSDFTQWAAIVALGRLGDTQAVPYLIDKLGDQRYIEAEQSRICDIAAEALLSIGSEDARQAVQRWRGESS